MASPHLLRPFTSRQLSLVEGDGRVMAFGVLGGRYAGSTVQVHAPTLALRVTQLPASISTVVFFDDPMPDGATVATIDDMLAEYEHIETDVLVQHVAATEAVKRVEDGFVREGIDRSRLVALRCPEVMDRALLTRAIETIGEHTWVNPTALMAGIGARLALFGNRSLTPIER